MTILQIFLSGPPGLASVRFESAVLVRLQLLPLLLLVKILLTSLVPGFGDFIQVNEHVLLCLVALFSLLDGVVGLGSILSQLLGDIPLH
jgi:hypothetical protein